MPNGSARVSRRTTVSTADCTRSPTTVAAILTQHTTRAPDRRAARPAPGGVDGLCSTTTATRRRRVERATCCGSWQESATRPRAARRGDATRTPPGRPLPESAKVVSARRSPAPRGGQAAHRAHEHLRQGHIGHSHQRGRPAHSCATRDVVRRCGVLPPVSQKASRDCSSRPRNRLADHHRLTVRR